MIDYQDKFDDLNDLPISEELLGAYAEGNLRGAEFREVQNLLSEDSNLSGLMNTIEEEPTFFEFDSIDSPFYKIGMPDNDVFGQFNLDQLEIPAIDADGLITAGPLGSDFTFDIHHEFIGDEGHRLSSDTTHHDDSLNNDNPFQDNGMNEKFDI